MKETDPYAVVRLFEDIVAEYTGAPYAVSIDNCSNALFLCLKYYITYYGFKDQIITIPSRTYMSAPCAIIHAGGKVKFEPSEGTTLKGPYQFKPTPVWDSALRFTSKMYVPGSYMCLSFSGPRKTLKLGKGGMILTDNKEAYEWFKMARFSGRHECGYMSDTFAMVGWNFYMVPEVAARGVALMAGMPEHNADLELPYPDLSKYEIYTNPK